MFLATTITNEVAHQPQTFFSMKVGRVAFDEHTWTPLNHDLLPQIPLYVFWFFEFETQDAVMMHKSNQIFFTT